MKSGGTMRYVIARQSDDWTQYYAGSKSGVPIWVNFRYQAFCFHGETEYDAAVLLAKTLGGKVLESGLVPA